MEDLNRGKKRAGICDSQNEDMSSIIKKIKLSENPGDKKIS